MQGVDLCGGVTVDGYQVYDIMHNKSFDERKAISKATNAIIAALRRKLGKLVDATSVVDGAWEVVETDLHKKYGAWQYGITKKWRDVNWDDKEQYFELIKHEQILPKSSFDLLVGDIGNVAALAAIPTIFGASGIVFSVITGLGGATLGYHIVIEDDTNVLLGYTYEPTEYTRLQPKHKVEEVPLLIVE